MAISKFNNFDKSILSKLGGISINSNPISYLINEDFEGTGMPAGWFNSGADFDSTVSPLAGAQSLRVEGSDYAGSFSINEPEVYLKFRVKFSALPGTEFIFISIDNSSFTAELALGITPTGIIRIYGNTGSGFESTVGTITLGVAYDMRIYFLKGTGSNGVHSVGFVEAGGAIPTSGNNYASSVTGTENENADHVYFTSASSGVTVDFDNIQLANVLIP